MKQKDIAMIVIVVFVSGIISFLISGKIFVAPKNRQQQVEVVDVIDSAFKQPDPKYFNDSSINPTKSVVVGENNNSNPFNSTSR